MPFINVHIGKPLTDEEKANVAAMIAGNMPILPGKTRDNTMIEISAGRDMFMGGEKRALVFVDMRVYHESPVEAKDEFVKALTRGFVELLDIEPDRQYYNIADMPQWGGRGSFHN